jgi:hypothetical protein
MNDTATWKPEDVVILVPILNRPHLIGPLMGNVKATTPEGVQLVFLPDDDDGESLEELARVHGSHVASPMRGWAGKLNGEVTGKTPEGLTWWPGIDYVFCCADDVLFHPGWLDEVMSVMVTYPNTRVVGTLDLLTSNVMAGEHATHFMVDRRYIDEVGGVVDEGPGSFLCEKYRHNYVDTEFIGTARARGVFQPSRAVVEHLHHLTEKAMYDDVYRIGDASMQADARIFEKRRHLWE